MKKFITALLVIAMIASFAVPAFAASEVEVVYTSPIYASADNANTEYVSSSVQSNNNLHEGDVLGTWVNGELVSRGNRGDIIDEVTVGEYGALNKNNGDVTTNKGYINDNTKTGVVTTNNDTVKTNNGTVGTNNGTVGTNNGTIAANNGTVSDNNGKVVVNVGTVEENDGKVEINFGEVEVDRESIFGFTTSLGTVDVNYGTVTENDNADDITIKYDAETETIILNNNPTTNLGIIVDKVDSRNTNTYVAVVYEDTEIEAEWTEAQQKALEAAGKLEDAKQYEGVQQAVNGTFYVYSAEKAAEMGISKEGYTLVSFEDAAGNIYKFSAPVENVKSPLFLKAVYEAIRHGVAYTADDFSLATNTATLVMNRKMYTDADLAAREMTVKVNGEEVSHNDFTVSIDENGNIRIIFTDAFMATLSAGEHHLQIKFANGVVYNVVIVK